MKKSTRGQAVVEYMFVLFFMIFVSSKVITKFGDFFRDSIGNLSHVLSMHLQVGICSKNCFFSGYYNGYSE
jgi:hypothetical protein